MRSIPRRAFLGGGTGGPHNPQARPPGCSGASPSPPGRGPQRLARALPGAAAHLSDVAARAVGLHGPVFPSDHDDRKRAQNAQHAEIFAEGRFSI